MRGEVRKLCEAPAHAAFERESCSHHGPNDERTREEAEGVLVSVQRTGGPFRTASCPFSSSCHEGWMKPVFPHPQTLGAVSCLAARKPPKP
ncbi:hypothetical protein SKAU_G00372700 [Synaphobranchus kaupii]|uniref:Uncharacterized protein n=1 Tax=Synaphobranchus kaupii TaxID=118154 RepID=A0A9Q1EGD7_SYNKA|nr:hypothetical protein SKAU_G00372700 [Synaphobranchus kaupii]